MKQLVTTGIILSRTDYGEADRIITLLTPDHGKLRLMAKGVRRIKSKLAGGIELFSVSDITFIRGRGEIGTLVSTRLLKHYGHIVEDLDRTMLGYELIKQLHKATEDVPESEYFELLAQTFEALDNAALPIALVHLWFAAQLLRLEGHTPELYNDARGSALVPDVQYGFDIEHMTFAASPKDAGQFQATHIKLLRLVFDEHMRPGTLKRIQATDRLANACLTLVQTIAQAH